MSSAEGRRYVRTERFASLKDHIEHIICRTPHPERGWTTQEVVKVINDETFDSGYSTYSNPVSGALSRLHNVDGKIVRLKERRQGFNVYVPNTHEGISGREYHLPRPPQGMEGDRLTPALVLEVLDGLGVLVRKHHTDLRDIGLMVWQQAKAGDVSEIQAAVDDMRGRE